MLKRVRDHGAMTEVKGLACDNKYWSGKWKSRTNFIAPTCAFCQIKIEVMTQQGGETKVNEQHKFQCAKYCSINWIIQPSVTG